MDQSYRTGDRIEHLAPYGEEPSFFDLSEGGGCCLSKTAYPIGSVISVRVGDLIVKARVVHSSQRTDGLRTGFQFIELSDVQRERLHTLVEEYSKGRPVSCCIVGGKGA